MLVVQHVREERSPDAGVQVLSSEKKARGLCTRHTEWEWSGAHR